MNPETQTDSLPSLSSYNGQRRKPCSVTIEGVAMKGSSRVSVGNELHPCFRTGDFITITGGGHTERRKIKGHESDYMEGDDLSIFILKLDEPLDFSHSSAARAVITPAS
eukprot:TRINITY_DN830_c0_g1_i8.p1 TRINITY_DN830_c0_g1~~TRINITY_DN830_c0_g1_i8.p1  ORF type:complete len:109 (+),score=5.52 TRINITY_DN830_c0_g1_i8:762-1088(+)